ncbi:MAG: hypothetical protein RMJ00_06950 [Nitrososphaerota archaeon]|nr:hypothetical protein [Candidatus Bathyarchaeota archaeon]MDW8062419.1 hypothetical protein [Nitrososphaerota archaeon]
MKSHRIYRIWYNSRIRSRGADMCNDLWAISTGLRIATDSITTSMDTSFQFGLS